MIYTFLKIICDYGVSSLGSGDGGGDWQRS